MNILRLKINLDEVNNIWFASDYHFYHTNVIKFDKRPFLKDESIGYSDKSNLDIIRMNETLIMNWNNVVEPDDIVFYLGDFCWRGKGHTRELAHRLQGKIHFILGNHDKANIIQSIDRFEGVYDYGEIWVNDPSIKGSQQICISHYPALVWNRHHHGSWYLHGHSHQNLRKNHDYYKRKVEDMGCNGWDYEPVSYQKLKEVMDKKDIIKLDHH